MGYEADLKLFIDGSWRAGEDRDHHAVINPATGGTIAELPLATPAEIDEALTASERAWPEWRAMDVEKRAAILHKTAALLRQRAEHIAATDAGAGQGHRRVPRRSRRLRAIVRFLCRRAKRTTAGPGPPRRAAPIRPATGRADATFSPWNFPLSARQEGLGRALQAAP
jgi:succinate-semialdehyde dehydrogenase/glutarate-semialdehyde dehydrogenase